MHICDICNYETIRRNNFEKHLKTFKHRRNKERIYIIPAKTSESCDVTPPSEIDKVIGLLGEILQIQKTTAAKKPKPVSVNYNINVDNLKPLTDEDMAEHIGRLSIDFVIKGAKGYAEFVTKYPYRNHVICTDSARRRLKYKNADGEMVDDPHGRKLIQKFFRVYADKNKEIIDTEYSNLQRQVQEIANGSDVNSDLTDILTRASGLQETLLACNEAAEGIDNKFTQEFLSHLAKIVCGPRL